MTATIPPANFSGMIPTTSRASIEFPINNFSGMIPTTSRASIEFPINNKYAQMGALGLASLLGPAKADSAILVTNVPVKGANFVSMDVSATNNNPGAVYNSAELNVFRDLAAQLYALPVNQTNYNSIADLMGDWNFLIDSTGDVSLGWNHEKRNDGSISITNNDFDWDQWTSNPGSNTQLYTLAIPNSQLDFTGVAGYDPAKAGIVLSSIEQPNMFIGTQGDGANVINYPADGLSYQLVIPEPKTYALLLGLIAGGAAMYRRRQNSNSKSSGTKNSIENVVNN